jgi:hypothetical protein
MKSALIILLTVCGIGVAAVISNKFPGAMNLADLLRAKIPENEAAVLHPIERIAFSQDWRFATTRTVKKGGHAFVILRMPMNSCLTLSSSLKEMKYFVMLPSNLQTPSSKILMVVQPSLLT